MKEQRRPVELSRDEWHLHVHPPVLRGPLVQNNHWEFDGGFGKVGSHVKKTLANIIKVGRAHRGGWGSPSLSWPNPSNTAQVKILQSQTRITNIIKSNPGRQILKSLVLASDTNQDGETTLKELEEFSDFDLVAWRWPLILGSVKADLFEGMSTCRFLATLVALHFTPVSK